MYVDGLSRRTKVAACMKSATSTIVKVAFDEFARSIKGHHPCQSSHILPHVVTVCNIANKSADLLIHWNTMHWKGALAHISEMAAVYPRQSRRLWRRGEAIAVREQMLEYHHLHFQSAQ